MISIKKTLTKILEKLIGVDARLGDIGVRKTATLSAATSIPSRTTTNLLSLDLESGVWIVAAQIGYQAANDSTYRSCQIANTDTGSNYGAAQVSANASGNTVVDSTVTLSLSSDTRIYLNALQGSNAAVTATTQSKMTAVRIK